MAKGYLYAVRMLVPEYQYNPVKIGLTKDPESRYKQFAASGPFPVEWIGHWQVKNMKKAETAAHARFAAYRLNGEWFFPSEALMGFIQEQIKETLSLSPITTDFWEWWDDAKYFSVNGVKLRHYKEADFDPDELKERFEAIFTIENLIAIDEWRVAAVLKMPVELFQKWRRQGLTGMRPEFPILTKEALFRVIDAITVQKAA